MKSSQCFFFSKWLIQEYYGCYLFVLSVWSLNQNQRAITLIRSQLMISIIRRFCRTLLVIFAIQIIFPLCITVFEIIVNNENKSCEICHWRAITHTENHLTVFYIYGQFVEVNILNVTNCLMCMSFDSII